MLQRRDFCMGALSIFPAFRLSEEQRKDAQFIQKPQNEVIKVDVGFGEFMDFIFIPPGIGTHGSKDSLFLPKSMSPRSRKIELTRSFYISRYLLTYRQRKIFMSKNIISHDADSWDFVNAKPENAATSLTSEDIFLICQYLIKRLGVRVTLPTEAQWEYACRAGSELNFYSGNDEESLKMVAWYKDTLQRDFFGNIVKPDIGLRMPNLWGLHDMLGTIFEPCLDDISTTEDIVDPLGSISNYEHLPMTVRGGHLVSWASQCTCHFSIPYRQSYFGPPPIGLRLVINS